jgi:hypothetical protein
MYEVYRIGRSILPVSPRKRGLVDLDNLVQCLASWTVGVTFAV